ncbi:zinc-dependent metalloprotease [Pedobacter glucosidilyticus]|uniref:zinc-dependent metalloprotease n=1 Tax=Pedobacter glucosidilyticus TaxID=1122941 RepID=UPI0026F0B634|nr:zinc-dependent metalloprotease [Pedobacter glucosidilyticus]
MRLIISIVFFSFLTHIGFAQSAETKSDSTKTSTSTKGKKKYEDIIPDKAITTEGLFTVKNFDGKYFFEIPDSLFNRLILTITRLTATPQGFGLFGGEKVNEQTIYFEKALDNRIFIRSEVYKQESKDSTQAIYRAVSASRLNPIVAAFEIKTVNPKNNRHVIEVTDFFKKDNPIVSLAASIKTDKKLSALADDRSFINSIHAYPINLEVRTTKTYNASSSPVGAGALTGNITLELNTSMVLLPKVPMMKRIFDERVGYFANKILTFNDDDQGSKSAEFIQRYRLEPREQDMQKYLRGELVEPKNPIVFYIDPATPKKWRPYLMAGVEDWQEAFEAAGFKKAIIAKEWPENDPTMSLEDARFSVIRYYASETPNAYGPRISDPRSGEIIESHVGWFHNVMSLLHDWYMIQAGPLDPRARRMVFDDKLMGELIRFVSSHEIGHTIGLRHNMGASSQTPVELLRDKKWVEANGHTNSIMDYARFNYVAQPEDQIGPKGIFPRIGAYDKWAIEWGYRMFYKPLEEETKILNKLTIDRLKKNPKLWFGGEGKDADPRSQREDLGDNAVKASNYGIENLKRVVENLPQWTYEDGNLYTNLERMHKQAVTQYSRYLYHVMKNFGNYYINLKTYEQEGPVYTPIPKSMVKEGLTYLDKQLFNSPLWLFPEAISSKIEADPLKKIPEIQGQIVNMLLSAGLIINISKPTAPEAKYPADEYLNDLIPIIWKKETVAEAAMYRRAFQRLYVDRLRVLLNPEVKDMKESGFVFKSDVPLYAREHALKLKAQIQTLNASTTVKLDNLHYQACLKEIDKILNPKEDK